jgi:putative ABC transport system permease protein
VADDRRRPRDRGAGILSLIWIGGLVRHRRSRIVGATLAVGLVVAVLASLGAFFAASKARMTRESIAQVPVDWQVQLSAGTNPTRAMSVIRSTPGVRTAARVDFAETQGFRAVTGASVQTTGSGRVLGVPRGYAAAFPGEVRFLVGSRSGVLIGQQLAANLHARVGSTISFQRPSLAPERMRVQGIIDLPHADSLFQRIGAPPGIGLQAPPDNVLVLPESTWQRAFGPITARRPSAATTQFHVDLAPGLPSDPGAAFADVLARAHNLEARLAGGVAVGNNIGAQLDASRSDALYAQLLFLFLGVPAALLAALLAAVIAQAGRERRRQEQARLRIRGAAPARVAALAAAEAMFVGVVGSLLGLGGAVVAGRLAFGAATFGANGTQGLEWAAGASVAGITVALLTILVPTLRDLRNLTVQEARAVVGPSRPPLWARLYLDLLLLAAAALVYWQTAKSGYQVVLAPEGVPTISVSYVTFLAPVLLWLGSALVAWRISNGALSRGRRTIAQITRPMAGRLSSIVAASMSRQRRLLTRALVIVALAGSFAVSTAVFNATYQAQARVDAELTNGSDVTAAMNATTTGLPSGVASRVRALPGVAAVEEMQHRFAYVGNDLQDLYGIDARTIGRATPMSDAFFAGGNAASVLARLAAQPDAVLVSDETVHDFQLQPGDLLRLRMQFASDHRYHVVPFHYAGIVREFPTAPRDSFLVANASYVGQQTGSPTPQTLLVKTSGPPPSIAQEIRRMLGQSSGATVQDIVSQLHITLTGLTALDLSGLTKLELAFAFILTAASSGVVLALGLAERQRTFAIASALGASASQLAAFVWSEAAFVTVGGMGLGVLAGWGLAFLIVKELTGVFDPPPEHLSIPWAYLAAIGAVTVVAVAGAAVGAIGATRRPAMRILRDL